VTLDFLDHLASECDTFGGALCDADPSTRVPTCPDWTAADLLWHVAGGAFAFWTAVVRLRDIAAVEALPDPDRPTDHGELLACWERSRDGLIEALSGVDDAEPIWTWSADHTAGWIKRRMAHEMLIHRVDAELTVGDRSEINADFAADGVDEVLRHFFGNRPDWAEWDGGAPDGPVGRIHATDTGAEWTVQVGALSGIDPSGRRYDAEPAITLLGHGEPTTFTVHGASVDLDLWLWHRPTDGEVGVAGTEEDAAPFTAMVNAGI
jgi:uncharacterized protein (TIGR03083 family)